MRTGKGVYRLTMVLCALGLLAAAAPVLAADDDDPSPKVYVTPGAQSTSKPLFLQRMFGSNPNAGGTGKPYDFGAGQQQRANSPREHEDHQAWKDKLDAVNQEKIDAGAAKEKQAIDATYAEFFAQRDEDEKKWREQQEHGAVSRATSIPHHARVPADETPRPMFYDKHKQEQNAHPPIFLH